MKKLGFAIVGAGPAAFYVAKCLSRLPQEPILHILDKEYCPFGLLRYGVAPDHITIKKTEKTLSSIANYPHFKYSGNTLVNQNVLDRLRIQYSGVIFATGAQKDNIPQWMDLNQSTAKTEKRMLNARDVVYWYNNHPEYEQFKLDLSRTRDIVIIGNGNVAIDISRVMLRPFVQLQSTQISQNALQSIRKSAVMNVILVARRGFTHSAFSLKELRQMTSYGIQVYCIEEELEASLNEASHIECTDISNHHAAIVRMNKRKIDFIKKKCKIIPKRQLSEVLDNKQKKVVLRFLLDPFKANSGHLKCSVTELEGQPFKQKAVRTNSEEQISYDLLVNSTGFKVEGIIQNQFDSKSNSLANSNGCLLRDSKEAIDIGMYAVGWCKNGPQGVIDQTLLSCEQTFNNIRIHSENRMLVEKQIPHICSKVNFDRYAELRELELSRGDKEIYQKKKLNHKEVVDFFSK